MTKRWRRKNQLWRCLGEEGPGREKSEWLGWETDFEIRMEKSQNGWRLVSGRESDKARMRSQKQAEGRLVGPLC